MATPPISPRGRWGENVVARAALVLACCGLALAARATDFPITGFGAVGDGTTLNTAAIQRAIEAAARAGGGTVVVPAGTFRSGSIFLKARVGLQLAAGATLLGSADIEDYPKQRTRIEGHFENWRMALVNASGVEHLRIRGPGRLDGGGAPFWAAFWQRRNENPKCTNLEVERPRLVFLENCSDVHLDDLTLENSGFWNIHLYRCVGVQISHVTIAVPPAPVRAPSTDGIDVDSSQFVTVRDSVIDVDDDCIALKGSKGPLADRDPASPPVEDITVERCEFRRGNGLITCGSEATVVRRVQVRDCAITGRVILACLKLRPDTPQCYEDLLFENIRFSGGAARIVQALPWRQFYDLAGQPPPPPSIVRNLTLRHLSGDIGSVGVLAGNPGDRLRDITLEDVHVAARDDQFTAGKVENLVLRDVVVNGRPLTAPAAAK